MDNRKAIPLSEKERSEFDNVTVDTIHSWSDVAKLQRLEAYMRAEGFPQTAEVAAKRLDVLGAGARSERDPATQAQRERQAAEASADLLNWTKHITSKDRALQQAASAQAGGAVQELPIPCRSRPPLEATQSRPDGASAASADSTANGRTAAARAAGTAGDVRSGAEYYRKWDRIADEELSAADKEQSGAEKSTSDKGDVGKGGALPTAAGPSNTRRVVNAAQGLTSVEREYQAEREKEKGNEFFKAKEYLQAVEAYTVALSLYPQAGHVHANRAAAYIKLGMWADAELDCDVSLELSPGNVKARMRRAHARSQLGRHSEALADAEAGLEMAPDDKDLLQLRDKSSAALAKASMKRIPIEVVDDDDEDDDDDEAAFASAAGKGEGNDAAGKGATPMPGPPAVAAADFVPAAALSGVRPGRVDDGSSSGAGDHVDKAAPREASRRVIPVVECDSDSDDEDATTAPSDAAQAAGAASSVPGTANPAASSQRTGADAKAAAESEKSAPAQQRRAVDAAPAVVKRRIAVVTQDSDDSDDEDAGATTAAAKSPGPAPAIAPSATTAPPVEASTSARLEAIHVDPRSTSSRAAAEVASATTEEAAAALPKTPQELAEALKQAGNDAFRRQSYAAAADSFSKAIAACPAEPLAYSNRAAAQLPLRAYSKVVKDATMALGLGAPQPVQVKALQRRSKARRELGDLHGAKKDLQDALALSSSPSEKAAIKGDITALAATIGDAEKDARAAAAAARAGRRRSSTHKYKGVTIEELSDDDEDAAETIGAKAASDVAVCISAAERGVAQALDAQAAVMLAYKEELEKVRASMVEEQRRAARAVEEAESAVRQLQPAAVAAEEQLKRATDTLDASAQRIAPVAALPGAESASEAGLMGAREQAGAQQGTGDGDKSHGNERKAPEAPAPDVSQTQRLKPPPAEKASDGQPPSSAAAASPAASADEDERAAAVLALKAEGASLFGAGNFAGAIQRYTAALTLQPSNAGVLNNRAFAHLQAGSYEACLGDVETLLALPRSNPSEAAIFSKALHRRAKALVALGRLEESLDVLEELRPSVHGQDREMVAADIHAVLKAMDRRREGAPRPTAQPPRHAPAPEVSAVPVGPAQHSSHGGESIHSATSTDEYVIVKHPAASGEPDAARGLRSAPADSPAVVPSDGAAASSDVAAGANDAPPAQPSSPAPAAGDAGVPQGGEPDADALRKEGNAAWSAGRVDDALGAYQRALALAPRDDRLHSNCSLALLRLGRVGEARAAAEAAVSVAEDRGRRAKAFHRRAQAAAAAGDTAAALADYERVAELEPSKEARKNVAEMKAAVELAAKPRPGARKIPIEVVQDESSAEENEDGFMEVRSPLDSPRKVHAALGDGPSGPSPPLGSEQRAPAAAGDPSAAAPPPERAGSASSGDRAVPAGQATDAQQPLAAAPDRGLQSKITDLAQAALLTAQTQMLGSSHPVPRTASDLKKVARALRSDKDALREYVHKIPLGSYKDILKCNLDVDTLETFVDVLQHDVHYDLAWCKSCLAALEDVERFKVVSALVSKQTRESLKSVRSALAAE